MPIKLIIFDLDGTLIDSSFDIAYAINYACAPYGLAPVTIEETRALVGEGSTRLIEKVIERRSHGNIDKDAVRQRFIEHYSAHLVDNTTLYPGVRETIAALHNYKKAVISNKRERFSRAILEEFGLARYLDIIVGSETTPERKPSPVPIRHVLTELNMDLADTVIVGDSNYDIEAGKAAGIRTIAVTYGYKPVELLRNADVIINKMSELINVLKRIE